MNPDQAYEHLRHGVASGRLAQAYIVAGPPRGEGRRLAERVLRLLYCREPDAPCGHCSACVQVTRHTHPDVLWVESQKRSRRISIDQIREDVAPRIYRTSFAGSWKACVLVGADRLTTEAANAFLKTLEEAPGRSLFLLLTESPQFLLPTVRSRCQRITLHGAGPAGPPEWRDALIETLTDERAGGLLQAFVRAEKLVRLLRAVREVVREEETAASAAGPLEEEDETLDARCEARYREIRTEILRFVLHWYRDLLLLRSGGAEALLYHRGEADVLRRRAAGLTLRRALANVAAVEEIGRRLERNLPEHAVFSLGFRRLH